MALAMSLPALAQQGPGRGAGPPSVSAPAKRGTVQQDRTQVRDRDRIYGYQLMTPAERNAYRAKMRSLNTVQEREAFRQQHHAEMQKRAQARGLTLPDQPRRQGQAGMGPGAGMGPDAGAGPGMMRRGYGRSRQTIRQQQQIEQRTRQQQATPQSKQRTQQQTQEKQKQPQPSNDDGGGH
ncbi:MAG: hypothetical protein KGJ94_08405 [Xanthomonadaceae bacterium]|nr:hypothetical protein [Xanthomonadaceae bacterium]